MKHPSGSIIVIALLMLSIILFLTQQLIKNVYVGSIFMQTMADRQQATLLAIGGINLAIAQLDYKEKDPEGAQQGTTPQETNESKDKQRKAFLLRVLPHINRWQTYPLSQQIDGIDGQIKICISCEDGKININEIYDFKKQEFKGVFDERLKHLEIHGKLKAGEVHGKLIEFFKQRQRKLDDVTELGTIEELKQLDIFYHPPTPPVGKEKSRPNTKFALQDMFTTWTDNDKVNLLWLSDALCALSGLEQPKADDAQHKQEAYKQLIEQIKPEMAQDWDNNFKIIEPIYGSKPKPELMAVLKNIFSKEFEPKVYSVLSYGKVGQVEQTLLAVIKRVAGNNETEQDDATGVAQKNDTKTSSKPKERFRILRLYWI